MIAVAPMYLYSTEQTDSAFIRIAGGLYTLTLLPAAVVAIWSKRVGGFWMFLVSAMSAVALCAQEIARYHPSDGLLTLLASLVWWILVAMIPAVIGLMILKSK